MPRDEWKETRDRQVVQRMIRNEPILDKEYNDQVKSEAELCTHLFEDTEPEYLEIPSGVRVHRRPGTMGKWAVAEVLTEPLKLYLRDHVVTVWTYSYAIYKDPQNPEGQIKVPHCSIHRFDPNNKLFYTKVYPDGRRVTLNVQGLPFEPKSDG